MKKGLKIAAKILAGVALLLGIVLLLLQIPDVQTGIVKKVCNGLEDKIEGKVSFSSISVSGFNSIVVKDVLLLDSNPYTADTFHRGWAPVDTCVYARKITATFNLRSFLSKEGGIYLHRVRVDGMDMNLVHEPDGKVACNLPRIFKSAPPSVIPQPYPDLFNIRRVEINDFHFRFLNFWEPAFVYSGIEMNWDDLDLVASIKGRNLKCLGGSISGRVESCYMQEKSGYRASVSGFVSGGPGYVRISDISLKDKWSEVFVDWYDMSYPNIYAFRDYAMNVLMGGVVKHSSVAFQSLRYYLGNTIPDSKTVLLLSGGEISGVLDDFTITGLEAQDQASKVSFGLTGNVRGLKEEMDAPIYIDAFLDNARFTTGSLSDLVSTLVPDSGFDISSYVPGQPIVFNASINGRVDSLGLSASLDSGIGRVRAEALVSNLGKESAPIKIDGVVSTQELDLGLILDSGDVGKATVSVAAEASLGAGKPSVNISALSVDRLGLLGYDYSAIQGRGVLTSNTFDGKIISRDPNLSLLFQGILSLPDEKGNALYKFLANIGYANLAALGFDKRGDRSEISTKATVNLRRTPGGSLLGDIQLKGLKLTNGSGVHEVGDIEASSATTGSRRRITFKSSFAEGEYNGDCPILDAPGRFLDATLGKSIPSLHLKGGKWNGEEMNVSLRFADCGELLAYLLPGAYIAEGSRISAKLSRSGELNAQVLSDRIAIGEAYLKDVNANVGGGSGALAVSVSVKNLHTNAFEINSIISSAGATADTVRLNAAYSGFGGRRGAGNLGVVSAFSRDRRDSLVVNSTTAGSSLVLNGSTWMFLDEGINYCAGDWKVNGFSLSSQDGSMTAQGGFSRSHKDTLSVDFNHFDLGIANDFLGEGLGLDGDLFGYVKVSTPAGKNLGVWSHLVCPNASLGAESLGELALEASRNEAGTGIKANLTNTRDGIKCIVADGEYLSSKSMLDATLDLDRFNPGVASALLGDAVSGLDGVVSGSVRASGPISELSLDSDALEIGETRLKVGFTGVPYTISGRASLRSGNLYIEGLSIKDDHGGSATVSGTLDRLEARLDKLELMDKDDDGTGIYGNLFASGDATVALGAGGSLDVDADLATTKEGKLHISLVNDNLEDGSSILSFREGEKGEEELYRISTADKHSDSALKVNAKCRIDANPNLEALLEIDKESGNVISGRGDGLITLDVKPGAPLSVGGDYSITEGKYHFSVLGNMANRDFTIQDGSSIKFNGDVLDSEFDVLAKHSLKTSLSSLMSDTTSVSTRRLVECGIHITERLRNPNLSFSITIPDLDPTTKSLVESELNTEDKVQKQFIALLLTGSFIPGEQSGVVNTTGNNILYNNLSSIMSGQLNNILQKLDIPLDLGLSYQQNEMGTDIFDVAVSTQLFGNRVVVNGSVGNRQYSTQSDDSVVGDVDIEVKLDDQGKVRLNLFSHSADDYTSYLDNTQRNGVGITYQQEYNKISDFFKRLFMSKEEKEAADLEIASGKTERTRITIDE
ncbi:MAG: translocation/assembly module TamB domain-containing protein [Bacteroidales bacterium]|nr:translocation/assembly module TamB domain-containing protein [Candidatus Cryptobacteroides aphodequi]